MLTEQHMMLQGLVLEWCLIFAGLGGHQNLLSVFWFRMACLALLCRRYFFVFCLTKIGLSPCCV
ncbi:hypothetical protein PRUPE_1G142300 [Prunus persica]|uniref:Uncharacterized protein n=1 Tax=Prunus persica TaxID=3760 RepID=A0A251QX77_PRUPE|nr:hypothetical protein PRUPE_1G142300 [Prunus persica]